MNEDKVTLHGVYVIENEIVMQSAQYVMHKDGMLMMYYAAGKHNRLPSFIKSDQVSGHALLADSRQGAIDKFVQQQNQLIELARKLPV